MGKPKKSHERLNNKPEDLGKRVLFIGFLGAERFCANDGCKKMMRKTMASEYKDQLYCNERCIKTSLSTNGVE